MVALAEAFESEQNKLKINKTHCRQMLCKLRERKHKLKEERKSLNEVAKSLIKMEQAYFLKLNEMESIAKVSL